MLPPEAPRAAGTAEHPDGPLTRLALIAVLPAVALACGCGDDGDETTSPAGEGTSLELTLDADGPGGEKPQTALIECPGDDPRCELASPLSPDDLAPVPADVACTEIYGGPDTLTVTGTLDGESVDAQLTRANGCEIDRFDVWTPLLRELFPGYRPGASLAPPG